MAWGKKVLQTKAEKCELKKLQLLKVNKELVSGLEPLLQDVYANRRPKPADYEVRRDLVRVFNQITKEIYGHSRDVPVVEEFGSFVMDLFSNTSDLDLSVNFPASKIPFPREKRIQTLRKFAKKLYAIQSKGHVYGVLPITTAKVPILKCVDRGTGVECDISVENRDGILKSQIIHIIASIDERFQKLSFLMKMWAKAYNINSSKDRTLNSLSIILLVAFHLQTRDPPVLPPFSSIFKDGTDPEKVVKSLSNFVNYGKRNKESLAELFVTFLIKLSSVEELWPKGLCASTCSGSWTTKTWDSKIACISVEDFTDPSQNVARAVGHAEVKIIYKCIDISIRQIFSFVDGRIGGEVKDLLFGRDDITPPTPYTYAHRPIPSALPRSALNERGKRNKRDIHPEQAKKMRMIAQELNVEGGIRPDIIIPCYNNDPMMIRQTGGWGVVHAEGGPGSDGTSWQATGGGGWERTPWQRSTGGGWGEVPDNHIAGGGSEWERSSGGGWGGTPRNHIAGGGWGGNPWS